MKRIFTAAFAAMALLSIAPAFAAGDPAHNSELGVCRGRIEEAQLRAGAETDANKKQAIMHQIDLANSELANGDAAKCTVQMDKVTKIDK